jgi:spore coat protein U-like protein
MKKLIVVLTGAIILAAAAGLPADTIAPTVNVSASVQGKCAVVTTPGAMAFTIDPSSTGTVNAVVSALPVIKCTKDHSYTVACTSTNTFNLSDGTNSIPYSFNCPADGLGLGFGATKTITLSIGGSVLEANYVDAVVGSYTDTVTITITY